MFRQERLIGIHDNYCKENMGNSVLKYLSMLAFLIIFWWQNWYKIISTPIKLFNEWFDKRHHKRESKTGFWYCFIRWVIHLMVHKTLTLDPSPLTQHLTASLHRFYGSGFIKLFTSQKRLWISFMLVFLFFSLFYLVYPFSPSLSEKLIFFLQTSLSNVNSCEKSSLASPCKINHSLYCAFTVRKGNQYEVDKWLFFLLFQNSVFTTHLLIMCQMLFVQKRVNCRPQTAILRRSVCKDGSWLVSWNLDFGR